jgi:hypothetical protein
MTTPKVLSGDRVVTRLGVHEVDAFVLSTFYIGKTQYVTLCIPSEGVEHGSIEECSDRFTVRASDVRVSVDAH